MYERLSPDLCIPCKNLICSASRQVGNIWVSFNHAFDWLVGYTFEELLCRSSVWGLEGGGNEAWSWRFFRYDAWTISGAKYLGEWWIFSYVWFNGVGVWVCRSWNLNLVLEYRTLQRSFKGNIYFVLDIQIEDFWFYDAHRMLDF